MAAAALTYTAKPTQVAISDAAISKIGMTITIANNTASGVDLAQVVLTFPQGNGATDLLTPGTGITTGSVHSSNGTSWSISASDNQVTLTSVSDNGYATLAPNDTLQFPLSQLQINSTGAGSTAVIAVSETDNNEIGRAACRAGLYS